MPDNLNKTGKGDRDRINVGEDHEVEYWTQELRVSKAQLERAVEAVGPMVTDVRAFLNKNNR